MTRRFALLATSWAVLASCAAPGDETPAPITAAASIRRIERGAILAEDFDAPALDPARWRVWQNHPEQTTVRPENGRLNLTARGAIAMEGLWGLTTTGNKDVALVAEMDIRSQGDAPHQLVLHLCGGDGLRSPDHWVEIVMLDLGAAARFYPSAALPRGIDRHQNAFIELPHPPGQAVLARLTLHGDTNRVALDVKTPAGWQPVCDPIELPLRTVHTEIKLHGQQPRGPGETTSQAWFDNVRIYPRPESHAVGVRLVRPDGSPIWVRENGGWPPRIVDPQGRTRSIEDIEVQLRTADGATLVSAVRSEHMGFYLLPLRDAPWDVYPVAAEVRVLLDGKPLGAPLKIECRGLDGLYPDDVYDAVLR